MTCTPFVDKHLRRSILHTRVAANCTYAALLSVYVPRRRQKKHERSFRYGHEKKTLAIATLFEFNGRSYSVDKSFGVINMHLSIHSEIETGKERQGEG